MTESWNNIRRRVRLVAMLQRQSATKEQMADAFGVHQRTINRDLAWLIERGVPLFSQQVTSTSPALWTIETKWDAAGWLWKLMLEGE